MPSRRQIREAVVQFLYCADMEKGPDPAGLREPFWEFVTESDRRNLHVATWRAVNHLALGRESRLAEFFSRRATASEWLAGRSEAEALRSRLDDLARREVEWSDKLAVLARLPKDDDDADVAMTYGRELDRFFRVDRDLVAARAEFLREQEDHPEFRGPLEAVSASIRRLQRISDRLRMVEEPEKFPDQTDLARIRESKAKLMELRARADELADGVLDDKERVDEVLANVVENFAPERIDPVDRAILRLAVHEMLRGKAPAKVSINEAVDLAKRFGTSDSGRFVNGVLDRVAADLPHPA